MTRFRHYTTREVKPTFRGNDNLGVAVREENRIMYSEIVTSKVLEALTSSGREYQMVVRYDGVNADVFRSDILEGIEQILDDRSLEGVLETIKQRALVNPKESWALVSKTD